MLEKTEGLRRPFATGSKPGPDAIDHYLEEKGFYRKHIARDASSLFRVIADQVFDIQNYHEKVRQDCAAYMETRSKEYSNEVDKNFFNYISQLRRPRTHGSLLELKVLAQMYRKNVILFEPTSNLQTSTLNFVEDDDFDSSNPLRVFYSHKDKHFDVIYTMEYVERLAECQALVYNILYADVFKLPDVQYAVERMLHDQEEELTLPLEDNPDQYKTQSGKVASFDTHTDSNCVLKDPKTCHFHNQVDFELIVEEQKDAITIINRIDDHGRIKIFKPIDGFLHDKSKSCVRQLLDEGITPFPYKVAKALDPSIYRNTEFELWSENRKEQRLKWLDSDFPMKQHLDEKNFMYNNYKNRHGGGFDKFNYDKSEQMIVDEDHYMALDDEKKKKYVILDHPMDSYKLHQLTSLDHFVPSKQALEMTVMPVNVNYRGGFKNKRGGGRYNNNNHFHQQHNQNGVNYHNQSPHPSNHNADYSNHQPMSYVSDIERKNPHPDQQCYFQQTPDPNQQQLNANQMYSAPPAQQNWSNPMIPYIQPQHQFQYAPLNYQNVMPYGNFAIPPPIQAETGYEASGDIMNILSEADLTSTAINWKTCESVQHNGEDLPYTDVPSLQFFFNLGVRYFLASGVQRRLESVALQIGQLDLNDNPSSQAGTASENSSDPPENKIETPPAPTNTPVSTKMGSSHGPPPGNRFNGENRGNNGNRRPFSNNREDGFRSNWSNNPRKEIKFNSNVKNLHKNESKIAGGSNKISIQSQVFHSSANTLNAVVTNQEKTSGSSTVSYASSASPVFHETPHYQAPVQPFYPPQQPLSAPPQQGMQMVFQVAEDGSYMQPCSPGIQYAHPYPFHGQPQQVFYPVHQTQLMDGSLISSNDSGIIDQAGYHGYQQMQYYPQFSTHVPMYYASSIPPTPQVAHITPVFPPQNQIQPVIQIPPSVNAATPAIVAVPEVTETPIEKS